MTMRSVAVFGATGSIGMNTLDVIARHPERFSVFAVTANRQIDRLYEQCLRFTPRFAAVSSAEDAQKLAQRLKGAGCRTEVLTGEGVLESIAAHPDVDIVMAAIVGAAGFNSTFAAARAGKRLLLANKEAAVLGGALFMDAVREGGATLLPIDSEHNAIFQALPRDYAGGLESAGVRRIVLTASGGPFRDCPIEHLASVTPEQACAHPNWVMGRKISVDSATMMNKGLEVIEAHFIFQAPAENIDVVVHPQSVIHSMVEYVDGSVIAQLGNPDMRTPIAHALGYPERLEAGVQTLDLCAISQLDFSKPDFERFPCLELAYEALREKGTAPAVLNAANEIAVEAFLRNRLAFRSIADVIAATLERAGVQAVETPESLFEADRRARELARDETDRRFA